MAGLLKCYTQIIVALPSCCCSGACWRHALCCYQAVAVMACYLHASLLAQCRPVHMLMPPAHLCVVPPVLHSPTPDRLQFACNLLLMLPEQVAKLSRRKTAHSVECCCAAATLAQVNLVNGCPAWCKWRHAGFAARRPAATLPGGVCMWPDTACMPSFAHTSVMHCAMTHESRHV